MNISEEQLKELVLRILQELEPEMIQEPNRETRQKLYMVCGGDWDERYPAFLSQTEINHKAQYIVWPVIPAAWQHEGYEAVLKRYGVCGGILHYDSQMLINSGSSSGNECLVQNSLPPDLSTAISVFPVVERTLLAKAALCISDTFETAWIAAGIEAGSRTVFLPTGLRRFSGREKPAYVSQVLSYCRKVLEYGIEICSVNELPAEKVPEYQHEKKG